MEALISSYHIYNSKLVYICHNLYGSDTKVVWCSSIEGSITYEV